MLSRPFSVVALMLGMALLGAASAMILRSEIPVRSEGNHAAHSESTQADEKLLEDKSHDTAAGTIDHATEHESTSDDPFSEESLGVAESTQATTFRADSEHSSLVNTDSHPPAIPVLHHVTDDSSAISDVANSASEDKITQQAVNLMTLADEQLASGSYVQAMRAYQTIREKSQGTPGTAILMRLAFCAEAAGRRAAALEAYRKVAATHADPAWAGVARYGEARCLAAVKRHDGLQTDLLRRVLLDESEFLPTVRYEVLHLIGRDLWQEFGFVEQHATQQICLQSVVSF